MRVQIDNKVHRELETFYVVSMQMHPTLDRETVLRKLDRLYDAVYMLGNFANIYPLARVRRSWVAKGYREMICEDFHFAFSVIHLEDGKPVVYVFDAVHSKLNY